MVDLGLPQMVQSLKAQAWSDEVRNFKTAFFDSLHFICSDPVLFFLFFWAARLHQVKLWGLVTIINFLHLLF